jgi:hypothetical protein
VLVKLNNDEIVWDSDSLRKKWDIRLRPEKELSSYQRTQLRQVQKQMKDFQDTELSYAIRRTIDGTLLEELEDRETYSLTAEVLN